MKNQYVRPLTLMIQYVEKILKGKTDSSTSTMPGDDFTDIRKKLVLLVCFHLIYR